MAIEKLKDVDNCLFMPEFYFAYGSNMNPARMRARELHFESYWSAALPGYRLRFNKRAHNKTGIAYANIQPEAGARLEGVLYRLAEGVGMERMDVFEGTPVRYSREKFLIEAPFGAQAAWVYVANPAYIDNGLEVEERYLNHLLSAGELLSPDYRAHLQTARVIATGGPVDPEQGLIHNV